MLLGRSRTTSTTTGSHKAVSATTPVVRLGPHLPAGVRPRCWRARLKWWTPRAAHNTKTAGAVATSVCSTYEPTTNAQSVALDDPAHPAAHNTASKIMGPTTRYGFHGSRRVVTPRQRQNTSTAAAAHSAARAPARRQMTATVATRAAAFIVTAPR